MKTKINNFMRVYMFILENHLLNKKNEIETIPFQSDEANTDRPLKEYIKNEIETSLNSIPEDFEITTIEANGIVFSIEDIKHFKIEKVLLPEQITEEIKTKIKEGKSSVYVNPDICFELNCGTEIIHVPVELKSTKDDSIPGSSIQQVDGEEWVIFIKHNKSINVVTGQYINAINSKMQFPDRSPRPQVSFKTLLEWNNSNRILSSNVIKYTVDPSLQLKEALITDWQDVLSSRWIDILFNATSTKKNEPWFNNNLRKFIVEFLKRYDSLSEEEKKSLKQQIERLIK